MDPVILPALTAL